VRDGNRSRQSFLGGAKSARSLCWSSRLVSHGMVITGTSHLAILTEGLIVRRFQRSNLLIGGLLKEWALRSATELNHHVELLISPCPIGLRSCSILSSALV